MHHLSGYEGAVSPVQFAWRRAKQDISLSRVTQAMKLIQSEVEERDDYLELKEKHSKSSMNNILGGVSTAEITPWLAHCSISFVQRLTMESYHKQL